MNQYSDVSTVTLCHEEAFPDSGKGKRDTYSLAPAYYERIRLHHGILPEGLDHMEMQLQKTRYYTFNGIQVSPSVQEMVYPKPALRLSVSPDPIADFRHIFEIGTDVGFVPGERIIALGD